MDGDRANSWLHAVCAGTRHTVELDVDGKVIRPQETTPDGDADTGAGARGVPPRRKVEMNDVFRAAHYGVSEATYARYRERHGSRP